MKCFKCDMLIPDDSEFCQYCGTVIKQEATAVVAETAENTPDKSVTDVSAEDSKGAETLEKGKEDKHKKKFCRHCGGEIDSETKKCEKCGKQFFKINIPKINKKSTFAVVVLSALLVVSIGANIAQYVNAGDESEWQEDKLQAKNEEIEALKTSLEEKTDDITAQKSEVKELKDELSEIKGEYNRYTSSVGVYSDESKKYHKGLCKTIKGKDNLQVTHITYLENRGYYACPTCYGE